MDEIQVIMPKRIPNELVCDLFIALDRNEMEKCQLVSRKWRQLVDEHDCILPLRRIYRLFLRAKPTRRPINCYPIATFQIDPCFNCNILCPIEFNGTTSDEEIARAKSLKHCVFDWCQFYCDVVREEAPCEEAMKLLERITKVAGQKLRAIKVDHSRIAEDRLDTVKKYIEFDQVEHNSFSWLSVEED